MLFILGQRVASVGSTEEEFKSSGREIKVCSFPFRANGRAKISMDTDGLLKSLLIKIQMKY